MKQLDEKGFVFIDGNDKPFWIRMWGGEPWIFRWNNDKRWVTVCRANQTQVWMAAKDALPDEQAQLYHDLSNRGFQ